MTNREPIRPPKYGARKRVCAECGKPALFRVKGRYIKRDSQHELCEACWHKLKPFGVPSKRKPMKPKTGTREWSSSSANLFSGCVHACRYCYAKANAIRFGRHTRESWSTEVLREDVLNKRWGRRQGIIMFPTTHDITPQNVDACLTVLKRMLAAGNRVLIVSKPCLETVTKLCKELALWQPQVTFRFTIGSQNAGRLKYWEPGAPPFHHRLASLEWALGLGWTTSVSMEPILDLTVREVVELALTVEPYVSETIWIGVANQLRQRVTINCGEGDVTDKATVGHLVAAWNETSIRALVEAVEMLPPLARKVRWKDSISKIIGRDRWTD